MQVDVKSSLVYPFCRPVIIPRRQSYRSTILQEMLRTSSKHQCLKQTSQDVFSFPQHHKYPLTAHFRTFNTIEKYQLMALTFKIALFFYPSSLLLVLVTLRYNIGIQW